MFHDELLSLNHQQQQQAVERVQQLMANGVGSGEAIARVANEIRQQYQQSVPRNAITED